MEPLGDGGEISGTLINLDTLHPVHREKDYASAGRFPIAKLRREIFEGIEWDATEDDAVGHEAVERTPELLARRVQGDQDDGSGSEPWGFGRRRNDLREIAASGVGGGIHGRDCDATKGWNQVTEAVRRGICRSGNPAVE